MLHVQDLQSGTAGIVQLTPPQRAPSPTATAWERCPLLHLPITCRTRLGLAPCCQQEGARDTSQTGQRDVNFFPVFFILSPKCASYPMNPMERQGNSFPGTVYGEPRVL